MNIPLKSKIGAAVCLGVLSLVLPAAGQQVQEDTSRLRLGSASAAKEGKAALEITPKDHVCNHFGSISCGQTVTGTLTTQDCLLNDGSRIDFWEFQGTDGQTATVTLTSSQVDTYVFLLNPGAQTVAQSDTGGGGTNARVAYPLNATGTWTIGANAAPNETGNYTLTLACTGGSNGGVPAAPSNLRATAASAGQIDLAWNDNSNNETSFRVEGRVGNGTFQDLGGLSANSTGATIVNLQPDTTYTFRIRARNANGDSPYSNEATATTSTGSGGGDGFLTTPAFPDFRFRVRITPQGNSTIAGVKETDCVPETLCVSGAVAGRSEVFVRIIGPRPNGYLWPTIVRFTVSAVEVWVQKINTGQINYYHLGAASPDRDELRGTVDRTGFLP
jgi:hypothetical protein